MNLNDGYSVFVTEDFWKEANKKLPKQYHSILKRKLEYFKENRYHPSLNTKPYGCSSKRKEVLKKEGVTGIYEFYINRKEYRCVFYVLDDIKQIIVVYIGNHKQLENKLS